MVKEIRGNLLEADENIIAHQTNCKGVMGAGVAKQIRNKLLSNEQYASYQDLCRSHSSSLLGCIQMIRLSENRRVCNLFGEDIPTGHGIDTDYDALFKSLCTMANQAKEDNMTVALPGFLGCGLAGGDWNKVYNLICRVAEEYQIDITVYYIMESVEELWKEFGDVPMDPDTECIENDWHGFKSGTFREDIWHWFEDTFNISVGEDLMHIG